MRLIDEDATEAYLLGGRYIVKPAKRGVWLSHPSAREYDVCSACGHGIKRREYGVTDGKEWVQEFGYHFCPWCGAKMEGAEG